LSLYRIFAQPVIRALVNSSAAAEMIQRVHPLRLQYEFFSRANPMMAPIATLAGQVRRGRKTLDAGNPFVAIQEHVSQQIVTGLDAWRDMSEALAELTFLAIYGLPMLQAVVGIDPSEGRPLRKAAKSLLHHELLQKRLAELKSRIPTGGLREAVIRGLLYVGMRRAVIDERGFELTRRIRQAHGEIALSDFKALVREQFNMLLIDQESALQAIPSMLPSDAQTCRQAFDLVKQVLGARGDISVEDHKRLLEVASLFGMNKIRSMHMRSVARR
jgi:hypothetical protein